MNKTCKPRINNIASQCINQNNKTKKNIVLLKSTQLESFYYIENIKHILKML